MFNVDYNVNGKLINGKIQRNSKLYYVQCCELIFGLCCVKDVKDLVRRSGDAV